MVKIKLFALIALGAIFAMCAPTKVEKQKITWEEAVEISWAEFLKVNNYQDSPWEEQPDSIQNEYLDCWAGSAQEDSILSNYIITDL